MRLTFLLFLLGCYGTAHAGWFGPKNYDECILENMKGVTIVQAVWAIQNSCRAKFPEACYAWQKAHPKQADRGPWEKYVNKSDPEMFPTGPQPPDGCYALLR